MMVLAYKSKHCHNVYADLGVSDIKLKVHKRLKGYIDQYSPCPRTMLSHLREDRNSLVQGDSPYFTASVWHVSRPSDMGICSQRYVYAAECGCRLRLQPPDMYCFHMLARLCFTQLHESPLYSTTVRTM
jgi:hypothetical protein